MIRAIKLSDGSVVVRSLGVNGETCTEWCEVRGGVDVDRMKRGEMIAAAIMEYLSAGSTKYPSVEEQRRIAGLDFADSQRRPEERAANPVGP